MTPNELKEKIFIAEVKTQSPFGFKSELSWNKLFDLANGHGDWISIHTDPRWAGSFSLLREARRLTNKPILAKGLHTSTNEILRCFDLGADFVLTTNSNIFYPEIIGYQCVIPNRLNNLLNKIILETNTTSLCTRAMWNYRDLTNGNEIKTDMKRARDLLGNIWLCQASFIKTHIDVEEEADAFIVGQHLPEFISDLNQ